MVKVISTEPHESVVKQVVCKHCWATLEYVPNEVKSYHGTDMGGGPDGREWVDCPNCNKEATIRSW
jgi:hypothetical protein